MVVKRGAMLVLVRHASTLWNMTKPELMRGRYDLPLTPRGVEEARKLGDKLCRYPVAEVWASDFQRDYQTGQIIADACKARLIISTAMRPYNIGTVAGLPRKAVWPTLAKLLANPDLRPPNGESYRELLSRWAPVLWSARAAQSARRWVVLIVQGTILRALPTIFSNGAQTTRTDRMEYVKTGEMVFVT